MATRKKLTKLDIKALAAPEPGTADHKRGYRLLWDGEVKGFGVLITSSGVISFIVRARINRRERRTTLGRFGVLSVDRARDLARVWLGEIAEGKDPVAEKKKTRMAGVTLADAIQTYCESGRIKPSTVELVKARLGSNLAAWLDRPLASITEDQVERQYREISVEHPQSANLVFRYFRAVWNYTRIKFEDSSGESILPVCPVRRLTKARLWHKDTRRERAIPFHRLCEWTAVVDGLTDPKARVFFWLCLYTGCRRNEAASMTWGDVDTDGVSVTFRHTKTDKQAKKPHVLPMPEQLQAKLASLRSVAVGDYVFGDALGRYRGRFGFANEIQIIKERYGEFGPHDLRRTFANVAETVGIPSITLKKLMNHSTMDVTAGYVGATVERLREPMRRIADYIETLSKVRDNVTPIRERSHQSKS
jgi:integrase